MQRPPPDIQNGDNNANFSSSFFVVFRIVLRCWRHRNGANDAERIHASEGQQGRLAQAGQARVHRAGEPTEYSQTKPGGIRSAVHGRPPGRAKGSEVSLMFADRGSHETQGPSGTPGFVRGGHLEPCRNWPEAAVLERLLSRRSQRISGHPANGLMTLMVLEEPARTRAPAKAATVEAALA